MGDVRERGIVSTVVAETAVGGEEKKKRKSGKWMMTLREDDTKN